VANKSAGGSKDDSLSAILIASKKANIPSTWRDAAEMQMLPYKRHNSLSSPAFEYGRITTVLATSFILPDLWVPFPSFNNDRYPRITSMRKLDDDFSSFSSLANFIWTSSQTFLGIKPGANSIRQLHEHGKLLRLLAVPMVEDTSRKVQQLITVLHNEHRINEMTKKWLCQTPNPPRIPVFYTLTKIHKPT